MPQNSEGAPGESPTIQRTSVPIDHELIDGRYVLEEVLGGGGMGVVYRARDKLLEEETHDPDPYVALKLLGEAIRGDPQYSTALQRECKRAQKLAHPNVVRVSHFGKDGDRYYLTMELLRGRSFEELLRENTGGLPAERALTLAADLLGALAYAHSQNIVHSDIKPSNLFLTNENVVKVLDFGIAAPLRSEATRNSRETFNPRVLGRLTPQYASLEMWLGSPADPRDDIYSAACVVYELMTGKHPYEGEQASVALQRKLQPIPVRGLSRTQNTALRKALALHAHERTSSVFEFQEGLISAKPERARSFKPRRLAMATGVIVAAALAGILLLSRTNDRVAMAFRFSNTRAAPSVSEATPARPAVDVAQKSSATAMVDPWSDALFSSSRACPNLESDWRKTTCKARQQCFATRASDALAAANIADPSLLPIYEMRARLFEELAKTSCDALDQRRDSSYREFIERFPKVPIS